MAAPKPTTMATLGHPDPSPILILAALLAFPEQDAREALRDLLPLAPWLMDPLAELDQLPLDQWQGEHTRLFSSGYPRTPCLPFESAYRQGRMGGTVVAELEDLYRRAGLEARGAPADYLGTLLECLALLAERGEPSGESLSQELWQEHLSHWLPRFSQDLQVHGELQLYRVLGKRLAGLCAADTAGLDSADGARPYWADVAELGGAGAARPSEAGAAKVRGVDATGFYDAKAAELGGAEAAMGTTAGDSGDSGYSEDGGRRGWP